MQPRDTDHRIRFIDRAVAGNSCGVFGHARPVAKRRLAALTRAMPMSVESTVASGDVVRCLVQDAEAEGIEAVFVNGTRLVDNGAFPGATPGTLLVSGRDSDTVPVGRS